MPETKPSAAKTVRCRVTKKGHDKIFTGTDGLDEEGKPVFHKYALNDVMEGVDPAIAAGLEERDLVEVLG